MSETSGHNTHLYSSSTTQTISQRPVPGGKDVRQQHPHDSPTTHASIDERVMDGSNPGDHHYHYSDAPVSATRTAYPVGPAATASSPKWSYYSGHYSSPVSDHDHQRPSHILPGPHNAPYPPPPTHNWDQTRPTHQHPSPPDQNFSRHHNLPHPGSYAMTPPSYGRQPHSPMEPAAAPSPPNLYPSSPRAPFVSQPPTNGLSSLPSLPSTTYVPSINGLQHHHGGHHSPSQYSPLNSAPPRRASGSMGFYPSSSPLSPGSKPAPLPRIDHPRNSINYAYQPRNGEPYPEEHAYPTSTAPIAPLTLPRPGHLPDAHHPRPAKIEQLSPHGDSQLTNGHIPSRPAEYSDHTDDDEHIKREATSRTVSASASPTAGPRTLAPRERRGSIDSVGSSASAKDERKRGPAVITDSSGRQYYEEDVLPLELHNEIPVGWQLGTGRKCAGKLLPLVKDGLQVHPEWGLTSAGKARQRLPKACVSCRTKKIKCVDSEGDSAKCQHCVKMKIPCSSDGREEKPARKNSKKTAGLKRKRESDLEVAKPGFLPLNGVVSGKKRKASEEGRGGAVKRGKSSRGSSFSIEPNDSKVYGAKRSVDGPARQPPQPTPVQEEMKPFAVPGASGPFVSVNGVPGNSEMPQRYQRNNPADEYACNGDSRRLSGAATPTRSYASASPRPTIPSHANDQVVLYSSSAGSSSASRNGKGLAVAETPPLCSIPRILGEDPRHPDLPSRPILEHLVDVYFRYVYSQTYAFLHRKTFEENLDTHRPVLLFSLCALAARFSREHSSMEEVFTLRARQLVLEHYADYKIDVVQSMVHLGLHDFGTGNGEKAWMFAGMAVRMGSMMYLHFGGRIKDFPTPISKEVARRTYWSYYLMDRLNSYGVGRPFLTQDHDCHVQLPCNQPSFNEGKNINTEHLLGPNPFFPNAGTAYMGAMAYLMRAVCIWGNILKRIHLAALESPQEQDSEFQRLIESLEKWRRTLPLGLQYSNENLAGQIQVGTAGAFVMMHVMWHTAMAYVHRYVRSGTTLVTGKKEKNSVIQSIRKTFVHADAVLQIMSHVHKCQLERGDSVVVVNAPFIGKAIFDACEISIIRAKKLKGMHNSDAKDQRDRVSVGLTWMKYLKGFWKPMNGLYEELHESYRALEKITPPPPSSGRHESVLSPDSGSSTGETGALNFLQNPYVGVDGAMFDLQSDMHAINQPLRPLGEALSVTGFGFSVPEHYYSLAFVSQGSNLYEVAEVEGAFPHLYPPFYGIDMGSSMGSSMDPRPTSLGSYDTHGVLGPSPLPLMNSHSFDSVDQFRRDMNLDESQPHQQSDNGIPHTDNEEGDTDAEDGGDRGGTERRETLSPSSGKKRTQLNLATTYFHPTAVRCGELVDPSGSESGQESRRPSDVAPLDGVPTPPAPPKPERNRMDLLHLLVTSEDVTQVVSDAVAKQETGDLGTGEAGIMAPGDGMVRGEINTDNSSKDRGH